MKGSTYRLAAAVISLISVAAPAVAQTPPPPASSPRLGLTPSQAVGLALRRNLDLRVERMSPDLTLAAELMARASFDPVLFGETEVSGSPGQISRARAGIPPVSSVTAGAAVGVRKTFSTGTSIEGRMTTSGLFGASSGGLNPAYQTVFNVSVRQPLLQGHSRKANEVDITSARLKRKSTVEALERKAETIAADTLRIYWDLYTAYSNVEIQKLALRVSERTLAETMSLIGGGKLPAADQVTARYQVAIQRRNVLVAEQELADQRDRLARMVGLVEPRSLATPAIVPVVSPSTSLPDAGAPSLQAYALGHRRDYLALKTDLESKRASVDAARHRLLPKLDFAAGLSFTGLSGETDPLATTPSIYDQSYFSSYLAKNFGWSAGLVLEIPLHNRLANARAEIALVAFRRAQLELERAELAISQQINLAWRAVRSARSRLRLTEQALAVAQAKLRNETDRYRAGKTSAQILTLVQSEVFRERQARAQAISDFNKSLVELWAGAGGLLSRIER